MGGQPSAVQICSRQIRPGARESHAGAVAIRGFQRVTHFALRGERQALFGYRRPGDVAVQAFQLVPFMGLGGNAGVQGKTGDIAARVAILIFRLAGAQGLQGEYFAPNTRLMTSGRLANRKRNGNGTLSTHWRNGCSGKTSSTNKRCFAPCAVSRSWGKSHAVCS